MPEVIGDLPGDKGIAEWVGVTGMLLELTGEARYAEEMERLYYDVYKNGDSEKMVKERILIVGTGELSRKIVGDIYENGRDGFEIIGFVEE